MEQCGPSVPEPLAEAPWALTRLRPDLAWPLSRGAGVTVAVIDSGVSPEHPSLAGKVLPGADFVARWRRTRPVRRERPRHPHRRHHRRPGGRQRRVPVPRRGPGAPAWSPSGCCATSGARSRTTSPTGSPTAVRWAVDNRRAQVINLSLTTPPTASLASAIRYAIDKGVVVVAAAGNEGGESQPGQPVYPAAYAGVIARRRRRPAGQARPVSSSNGTYVDVAAPGMRIAGPSPLGGGYLFSQEGGTSFAAAYVSGVAALHQGRTTPDLTPAQVAERITATADHAAGGWNADVGYGVINPARAVGALLAPAGDGPAALDQAPAPAPPTDADRPVRVTALWIGVVGAALVIAILAGIPVVRRGRQRHWR